jgi:hypothetical protein
MMADVNPLSADGNDADDPVEILAALPAHYRQQFLTDYHDALASARSPENYRKLRHALRLWRLVRESEDDAASVQVERDLFAVGAGLERALGDRGEAVGRKISTAAAGVKTCGKPNCANSRGEYVTIDSLPCICDRVRKRPRL